jgi:hypothetical protein
VKSAFQLPAPPRLLALGAIHAEQCNPGNALLDASIKDKKRPVA